MKFTALFATLLFLLGSVPAALADTVVVRFPHGGEGVRYNGSIRGYESDTYIVDAKRGQKLVLNLRSGNRFAYFNILPPGSDSAIYIGSIEGNISSTVLPRSGKYRVQVYLMRNAARRGEVANYRLRIRIPAGIADDGDYADGDDGGPDNWIVSGVANGDQLNIRTAPSANAELVARVRNGTVLRNLGCRTTGASRWCRVATRLNDRGWANGRYLREY
jgi:Bacterial SH3 domain